jgi:hypothetical protein
MGPLVLLVGVACGDGRRESAQDFTSAAEAQRTDFRRGWLFPSPGRRSPTGLLPGAQPATTTPREARQHHRRLRSRQKSGCLRGQARGTTDRTTPPNKQPAGRQAPSFPEPGPPEAQLTLISSSTDNRQEPTRRQAQTTARVEDDRREDDQPRPRSAANVGAEQRTATTKHQRNARTRNGTQRSAAPGRRRADNQPRSAVASEG